MLNTKLQYNVFFLSVIKSWLPRSQPHFRYNYYSLNGAGIELVDIYDVSRRLLPVS